MEACIAVIYNLYSYMFRHFRVIIREFISASHYVTQVFQIAAFDNTKKLDFQQLQFGKNLCNLARPRCKLV